MMTSQSEYMAWPASCDPVQANANATSRLIFQAVDATEAAKDGDMHDQPDRALCERVAALSLELRLQAEAISARLEEARQQTRVDLQSELEAGFKERLARKHAEVSILFEQFAQERARYFSTVEHEVVRLSLAIAARILHREVNMDPLLLAGAVRVALEKIQGDGEPILRIPARDLEEWKTMFSGSTPALTIIPDEHLEGGTCLLETPVGSVDLGITMQLTEIERGFFDLLKQRPV
jgi:flagellar assembly protein FliH